MTPLRIFIGYDHRQRVAYTVCHHSLMAHASKPIAVTPLVLDTLPTDRGWPKVGLTPFTYSRFLVPWLCRFEGWALFVDIDTLFRADVTDLFEFADPQYRVMMVKHEGDLRFERPSVMLFNCERCDMLTPAWLNATKNPFGWCPEDEVGPLPGEWNHLVGYDPPREDAKLVHYTQGVPVHPEIKGCEHTLDYDRMLRDALTTLNWEQLMGPSKHAVNVGGKLVPRFRMESENAADQEGSQDQAGHAAPA